MNGIASGQDWKVNGADVYRTQCLGCHGKDGQGGTQYDEPLAGELSVQGLASLIQETMPEDEPGSLTDQQAQDVAQYVFRTFYSRTARAAAKKPRIELSRLTAEQYRQSVLDLVGSFSGRRSRPSGESGLTAEYFDARNPHQAKTRKQKRVDARIDFDFGIESPVSEIEDPRKFAIRWSGSVRAPETGLYSFSVSSPQAIKLFVNSPQPRIDAWVKSTGEDQHTVDLFLTGGRRFPIDLEFAKSKQGVDDSEKQKTKPPIQPGSISLSWKRPRGVMEVIPERFLSPIQTRVQLVCSTPFPPEDESYGWVRSSAVSREWDQATTTAALQVTSSIMERLDKLAVSSGKDESEEQRLRNFCLSFAKRAFRIARPDAKLAKLIDRVFEQTDQPDQAVKRILLYTLKSPRFLYREIHPSNSDNVAERLSFAIWNSIPDGLLLRTGVTGKLSSAAQIKQQVSRMLEDPRAKHRLNQFLLTWLQVNSDRDINKDLTRYPGFDDAAIADMRASLELHIDEVLGTKESDFRQLMMADQVYLNRRLAILFAVDPVDRDGFTKYRLDPEFRAGVLTHPYLLSQFAYRSESSPIHRGVFIARNVLGTRLNPPPEAVAPLSPRLKPDLTTRQRVALQTKSAQCMACHQTINSLGFAFENFDAVGRYRDEDRGKPVDTKVAIQRFDQSIELDNARQLAQMVIDDPQSQAAFCEQLFHFLAKQSINAYGQETSEQLRKSFVQNEFNIRLLAQEILMVLALHGQPSPKTDNLSPASN